MKGDLKKTIREFSEKYDTDLYLFSAEITYKFADEFIHIIRKKQNCKKNCSLILTSNGGDPDAGYRIIRFIKRCYPDGNLIIYILGLCKSSGTLMVLGADEIVMGDFGELGPLDIQMPKEDELFYTSSLNYMHGLYSLADNMFAMFEQSFLNLKFKSRQSITTKTAADISCNLAIGLVSPIAAQIDPVKLGEVNRAINITKDYGARITKNTKLVNRLISDYPSHTFVIDFEEAKEIFDNVRWIKPEESFIQDDPFYKVIRVEDKEGCIYDLNSEEKGDLKKEISPKNGSEIDIQQETDIQQEADKLKPKDNERNKRIKKKAES